MNLWPIITRFVIPTEAGFLYVRNGWIGKKEEYDWRSARHHKQFQYTLTQKQFWRLRQRIYIRVSWLDCRERCTKCGGVLK